MATYPLVGAYHRPPALALISVLQIGTPLTLVAEPENPYDENAVAVWLYTKDISEAGLGRLDDVCSSYGHSRETIVAQEVWHLGYIAREFAAKLRSAETVTVTEPKDASFSLSSGGAPRVRLSDG